MNKLFNRWLPAIEQTSVLRKGALGLAGLALVGGAVAGPAAASAVNPEHARSVTVLDMTARPAQDDATQGGAARNASGMPTPAEQPDRDALIPHGVQGPQAWAPITDERDKNVREIVKATKKAGMDERAAVIAVATSLQESKLENLGHLGAANDHDSQGLFQQRPSTGWGTVEQIRDPQYSTTAFLNGLKQVEGWRDMPLTQAAQKVQVSAYPQAYAKWENQAADLVAKHWNDS